VCAVAGLQREISLLLQAPPLATDISPMALAQSLFLLFPARSIDTYVRQPFNRLSKDPVALGIGSCSSQREAGVVGE
jgi:hypothetical protein